MSRRRRSHPRGPRRFRIEYEERVPKLGYAWVKRVKAFSSPGARDDDAHFLATFQSIRNVRTFDLPYEQEALA